MGRTLKRIDYSLLLLIAFLFPLWQKGLPVFLVCLTLVRITRLRFERSCNKISFYALLSFLFYGLYGVGVIYSQNWDEALFDLEVKLSFLVLPLVFGWYPIDKERKEQVIFSFIIGCMMGSLICGWEILQNYLEHPEKTGRLYRSWFSILMHPGYFALYLNLAIFGGGYLLYNGNRSLFQRMLLAIALPVCFGALVMTKSRAGMLTFLFLLLLVSFWLMIKGRKPVLKWGLVFFLIGLFSLPFMTNIGNRFEKVYGVIYSKKIDTKDPGSVESRLLAWGTAWEIYKENPFFGVGTGDVNQELQKKYKKNGYKTLLEKEMNCHDQFLQTLLAIGLPGLILLLSLFSSAFKVGIIERDFLLVVFLIIILISAFFESIFETQAGVVFYNFFISIFLFLKRD